jgi:HSP20 family molecular chaperone IbpA
MDEHEVAWPTGMSDQDPAARDRPLVFNPQGFLVAILEDDDQAEQARATLAEAGFAERDLRVYTSQQILDSWERFQAERSLAQRVAGAVTDDPDTIELYFGSARQGRSALWVRVPEEADAKRAVRALADNQVLHIRYYGQDRQDDIHIG